MTSTVQTTEKYKKDEIIEVVLRDPPPGVYSHVYVVHHPSGARYNSYEEGAIEAIQDGFEVELWFTYERVEVDGFTYTRSNRHALPSSQFYTFKEDFTHAPDDHVYWDSAFTYSTKCTACERPWEMDDRIFLDSGNIQCRHCGFWEQRINSQW